MPAQDERFIGIGTPLGEEAFVLGAFHGREEVGRLFSYELELTSADRAIDFDAIVGENVTVRLDLPGDEHRFINGHISRFVQTSDAGEHATYAATLVPWLWFLTQTTDCRIFQNMKVPDILEKVFSDLGFSDYELRIDAGRYREWEYCVQYRETDFNFVSRLMEQEGIYYFFAHENGTHTLVLCDSLSKHDDCPGYGEIPYLPPSTQGETPPHVSSWRIEKSVRSGRYSHVDYNFKKPRADLKSGSEIVKGHTRADLEVYDYPGEYAEDSEGESYARVRIEELQARQELLYGEADARGIVAGYTFTMIDYPREDQNRKYLVVSAECSVRTAAMASSGGGGGGGGDFACRLTAIDAATQFRPERVTPKPIIQGAQTAVVVGPPGEEIWPDEYGRVKVQFFWDREGQFDENSSCWVRVSQVHAGKGFGSIDIPRIGEEVIVGFMEGDPDQPIIIGRVYNDEQKVPFGLPDKKVVSGMKSNSTKGGGGYNEMVMDDTKGNELIRIHAQYDMDTTVENDQRRTVHNNRTTNVDVDDTETVGSNQSISVGSNQTTSVGSNQSLSVGGNQDESVGGNQSVTVGGSQKTSVGGSRTVDVAASDAVTIGGSRALNVGSDCNTTAGANVEVSAGANMTLTSAANTDVSAGATISIAAGAEVTISAGGSSIKIGPAGITLSTGGIITEMASMIKHNT